MNVVETIYQKVIHLPLNAQEMVLDRIEEIEAELDAGSASNEDTRSEDSSDGLLAKIYGLAEELSLTDIAAEHDHYAHGKLEN